MSMTYQVRQARDITVIDLGGQISLSQPTNTSPDGFILHGLVREILKTGRKDILLNFRDVSRVDSSGIGELFACYTSVRNQGGTLKVTQPSERIENLLRLTRLDTIIEVVMEEPAAVESFAKDRKGTVSAA